MGIGEQRNAFGACKKLSGNSGCAPSASESAADKAGKAAHIGDIWVVLPNAGSRAKATRGLQTASKKDWR